MALNITPNTPLTGGQPVVEEGASIPFIITNTTPGTLQSVRIQTSSSNLQALDQTVTFVPGGALSQTVVVQSVEDSRFETNEGFNVTFTPLNNTPIAINGGFAFIGTQVVNGTLTNDDVLPSVGIAAQTTALLENAADRTFKFDLTRTGADLSVITDVTVGFSGTGTTPADQTDFVTSLGNQFIRFQPNETSKTITLEVRDDATIEAGETLLAFIGSATSTSPNFAFSGTLGNPITPSQGNVTVSILNDDPNPPPVVVLPTIGITTLGASLFENAANRTFEFDLTRSGSDLSMITDVSVGFNGTGLASADHTDFVTSLANQSVRFLAGETTKRITLEIRDDALFEPDESLSAFISSATSTSSAFTGTQSNPLAVGQSNVVVSILNDDPAPPVVTPPVITPPIDTPPVVTPPVITPPVITPPIDTPPVLTPPVLTPPVVTPPVAADPVPIDVFRFYETRTGTHLYTTSTLERDVISNTLANYRFEGVGFQAVPDQPGADAVYRFFRSDTGTHFYTPSEVERDSVMRNLPQYKFEGIGFHASEIDGAGLTEVFRFFKPEAGVHFYTASVVERDSVMRNLPNYTYEGVSFYVPESKAADYSLFG